MSTGDNINKFSFTQYIVPMASRLEMKLPAARGESGGKKYRKAVIITRLDKKVMWMIMPEQKGFCEFTFKEIGERSKNEKMLVPISAQQALSPFKINFKRIKKGRKILGYKTEKYKFWNEKMSGYTWLTGDKRFSSAFKYTQNQMRVMNIPAAMSEGYPTGKIPLKMRALIDEMKYEMDVKSVKIKRITSAVFKVPEGYTLLNKNEWNKYQRSFDVKDVLMRMKSRIKEEVENSAKESAEEAGKSAVKKTFKSLLGF